MFASMTTIPRHTAMHNLTKWLPKKALPKIDVMAHDPYKKLSSYPLGIEKPTRIYFEPKSASILAAEKHIILDKAQRRTPDLDIFIEYLCNPLKCLPLIQKVDTIIGELLALEAGDSIAYIPSDTLLQTARKLVSGLARHYGFESQFIETGSTEGTLPPETFKSIIENHMLLLDVGETGHGPIPHLISACMMKEMERVGLISDSKETYKLLVQLSTKQNDEFTDYINFFVFAQDNVDSIGLSQPATFANFIIENSATLPHLSPLTQTILEQTYPLREKAKKDYLDSFLTQPPLSLKGHPFEPYSTESYSIIAE